MRVRIKNPEYLEIKIDPAIFILDVPFAAITPLTTSPPTVAGRKFCRKNEGETHSYMHRDLAHMQTFDSERENDTSGTPVLKK